MPPLPNTAPFLPEQYYHIYNHAVGDDNLFRSKDNYRYFLSRFKEYTLSVCQCFAYCLMPNHFHFLIRVRTKKELEAFQLEYKPGQVVNNPDYHKIVMNQFRRMLNGYAQAYNKRYERKGALFLDYMKRKEVTTHQYLANLIAYIHHNPVHHNYCSDPGDWEFSSYNSLCSSKATGVEREEVLRFFGQREDFISFHLERQQDIGLLNEFEF